MRSLPPRPLGALRPAQQEQREDLGNERPRDGAAPQEIGERQQEYEAHQAAQKPVRPFPIEDRLEALKVHSLVHDIVLGDLLVFLEGVLPRGLAHRRQRANDGLPFRDRQAGTREPRGPAHDDHGEHERCDNDKPDADGGKQRRLRAIAAKAGGSSIGKRGHSGTPNVTVPLIYRKQRENRSPKFGAGAPQTPALEPIRF